MKLKVNFLGRNRWYTYRFRFIQLNFPVIRQNISGKVHLYRNKFFKEFGVLTVDQDGLLFL